MSRTLEKNYKKIPRLFGTSGIRGEIGNEITSELALEVGKALATYLGGEGLVVVGYDTRTSNQMLNKALCSGLLECGCNVVELGMVPTPLVGFSASRLKADAGVMITASHNPAKDNGIKLWNPNGIAFSSDQERKIEALIHTKKFKMAAWDQIGSCETRDEIINQYIDEILEMVNIKPGLKIVVDCGSGAASYLSPLILRKAGCRVTTLNCQPDGFFPGREAEPNQENLEVLMKTVKKTRSHLGIAHDGDADRMVAVDEKGNFADFDKLLALISQVIGGKIITTVDASLIMDECLSAVGGEVIRTKVGDVHVAQSILQYDASFGGEPSGTWIHPDFCLCPDGILSALRVIELVSNKGDLSKQLDSIPNYPTIRKKIGCSKVDKEIIMDKVKSSLKDHFKDVVHLNDIDGMRISFEDGSWVLIRPSGTESYIRITLEARNQERAEEISKISTDFVQKYLSK